MSFNAIRENKILAKISGFTVALFLTSVRQSVKHKNLPNSWHDNRTTKQRTNLPFITSWLKFVRCLRLYAEDEVYITGHRREKPVFGVNEKSEIQASLLSYRDQLENWKFACSKSTYDSFEKTNNKGADQSARMRRLVCALVVHKPPEDRVFSRRGPYMTGLPTEPGKTERMQWNIYETCH